MTQLELLDMGKINKHEEFIVEVLTEKKHLVSTKLCEALIEKFEITSENARKVIQRAKEKNIIKSSAPLTFSKGQFAYSLPNTSLTKDRVKEICKEYRPALFRLLESIDINDGVISYYEALKITASPLNNSDSKADRLDDLIKSMEALGFIYLKTDANSIKYIISKSEQEDEISLMHIHYSKMLLDALFVKDILDWIAKSNLISNQKFIYRNKNKPTIGAEHNNLLWDAFGYTKTTGINTISAKIAKTQDKQTLVILDIVISRDYDQIDLDGFLSRIQININSVKSAKRKVLPIIIYKSASSFLLNKIKSLGFLSFDLGSIYGSNIFGILDNLSKLQLNKNLIDSEDFETTIEETLKTIKNSGQEDQLKALKGTLFEVMMYQVLKHQYPSAEIQPNVYYSKKRNNKDSGLIEKEGYEYDYIIKSFNPREIIVIELKGYNANHKLPIGDYKSKYTLKWFFNRTLPFIRDKFKNELAEGYKFKAAYFTTSQFEDNAFPLFDDKYNSFKPNNLDILYDREKLLRFTESNEYKSLSQIIDKFY